jgi:phosphate transport system protein
MAALVEKGLRASLQGLLERNRRLAYGVILRDQLVDELEMELDQLCLEFLARQQPVAGHLRFVFAMIQIDRELERVGDYAESIARQVLVLGDLEPQPCYPKIQELGHVAIHMLHDAFQAFLRQEPDLARRTMAVEERANALRNQIMAELNRLAVAGERASDQAKNICEEVLYMCTGTFAKHPNADKFRILFLDAHNSRFTQIAEAIARRLSRPEFVFASAGIEPQPIDPAVAQFLRVKGLDISTQSAKSLEQVPDAAQFQVIVSLGSSFRDALPAREGKTIHLTWPLPEPPAADLPIPESQLEAVWTLLQDHIGDLVAAILDFPLREARP